MKGDILTRNIKEGLSPSCSGTADGDALIKALVLQGHLSDSP